MSKTITIGVLSPVTGGSYYGKILAGITREVAAVGGRVVLVQTLDAGLSSDEVVGAPDFVDADRRGSTSMASSRSRPARNATISIDSRPPARSSRSRAT